MCAAQKERSLYLQTDRPQTQSTGISNPSSRPFRACLAVSIQNSCAICGDSPDYTRDPEGRQSPTAFPHVKKGVRMNQIVRFDRQLRRRLPIPTAK
jgi:hypothetical protein